MIKGIWKDYFTFSKKERNAVFVLLAILVLLIVAPYFVPAKKMQITIDEDLQQQLDKYQQQHPQNTNRNEISSIADSVPETSNASRELFLFDPNTLNEEGLKKLGLPDKVIHTLINYRNKGGYFKTPDDIRKIYGLSKTDADRLIPYIKIASSNNKKIEVDQQPVNETVETRREVYKKININTATAEEWKALPGIGDVLSNRIVKFRTKLGGFKSIDDVHKTYGLSDSTFQVIRPYLVLKDSAAVSQKN